MRPHYRSVAFAACTLIGATVVLFVVDDLIHSYDKSGIVPYVLFDLLAAAACFFIIKQNPKSIWYVPLIVNSLLILSAFVEGNFWKNPPDARGIPMWIPVCAGWVLCLAVSVIAVAKGKQTPVPSSNPKKPIGPDTP